ncbi:MULTISPECIES: hypothetical protein [unclassified Devosia]|jgi:hypothetical protein|uniref:hypothetical protein n=1 Tax=unclassified Devosia TaxID=196773 RepID=UPI00086CEA59|nr:MULTISPECIES: hypothetical protein [unclassified Devosia]MBN9362629.1 hypothetical protein [Devosia sp.]ODS94794.1 MAG: hypothetical protein ABS47_05085 [Devosia sp. SCN 66-27]OJX23818.1 MAG: hypothetical protein BGO83_02870 [Devosia sp. 66-14]
MSVATSTVSASDYLRDILARETVRPEAMGAAARIDGKIAALCHAWGSRDIVDVTPGGGFEKSMANRSGVSLDYVVWIHARADRRIPELYESMFSAFQRLGLAPVRRNVTLALNLGTMVVDLLPAKRLSMISDIHEIYSTRRGIALTTNLHQHVLDSHDAGWQEEVRVLKLWRDQNGLDFPSYYLELATQAALRRRPAGALADNVWAALGFFERLLVPRAMLDPANAANVVSDELTAAQKRSIALAAAAARSGRPWSEIVR